LDYCRFRLPALFPQLSPDQFGFQRFEDRFVHEWSIARQEIATQSAEPAVPD